METTEFYFWHSLFSKLQWAVVSSFERLFVCSFFVSPIPLFGGSDYSTPGRFVLKRITHELKEKNAKIKRKDFEKNFSDSLDASQRFAKINPFHSHDFMRYAGLFPDIDQIQLIFLEINLWTLHWKSSYIFQFSLHRIFLLISQCHFSVNVLQEVQLCTYISLSLSHS